jgi:predicted MFS family arabinose efflux permease
MTIGEPAASPARNPFVDVLLPFAGGYFLSYLYRSVNAIIGTDLAREFQLSPADLGLLTSAYFLTFAAFQLPLGLLLDRFGPRRTDAALLLIAAVGAAVFASARQLPLLILGRALIGLGVSGCLMSGIKANVIWFPLSRLSAVNGWMFCAGGAGMIAATLPVQIALHHTGWRTLFLALAAATIIAALAIFRIVPERKAESGQPSFSHQLEGLRQVFVDRRFWRIAVAATLAQSTNMALQSLWSGPWLRDVAGLDPEAVAVDLLLMACATTIGFLFWGNFAERIAKHGVAPLTVFLVGMGMFLLFQLLATLGWKQSPLLLWMGFGFFGTAGSLAYAILPQAFPLALAGRVNTALNSLVFGWAFVVQWAVGAVLSLWPVTVNGYATQGYRWAFGVFLLAQTLAWGWMVIRTRDTAH